MSSFKTSKITEGLSLQALKEAFFVGRIMVDGKELFIDNLTKAVDDGTMDRMVKEAADKLHNGDTAEVIRAMARNLSSLKTNLKKRGYVFNLDIEKHRYEVLKAFVDSRLAVAHTKVSESGVKSSESYWTWSIEQIQKLDVGDIKLCSSVYNNMHSAKSKYPDKVAADPTFVDRLKVAADKFSAAKKLAKAKEAVPADLINRLAQGKTTLSKEEALELLKALSSR